MAGGGKVRICDRDDFGMMAQVINGALRVTGIGGGGGGDVNIASVGGVVIGSTVPVSGTVTVLQGTSPWVIGDGGGSITVDGTVAVTQSTSPWVVSGTVTALQGTVPWVIGDGGGSITVDGTVAVSSVAGTVTIAGTVAVSNVTPGTGLTDLGKATGGAFGFAGDVGVAMLAVDTSTFTWQPFLSTGNSLHTNVNGLTPGTAAVNLGKAEDALHASGDVGVMALAVRQDVATALAANNDYIPLTTAGTGGLWVTPTGVIDVAVLSVIPGIGSNQLGKESLGAFAGGDVGVMMLAVRESDAKYVPPVTNDQAYLIVALQSGSTIDVNSVSAVIPGTAATQLGKAEDNAHASGDVGVMMLCVRQDTLASLAGATNDYMPPTLDNLGRLHVINEGGKTTYRAATTVPFAAAAGAVSFFVISGSGTKTIRVQRIVVSGFTLTAVAYHSIVCEKWSTAAFTGGTPVALTKVPVDSNYAAATAALVQVYTAAPTEGTLVGTIAARRFLSQATTAAAAGSLPPEVVFDFRVMGENNPGVLRGTTESIGLAFAAAPATAVTMSLEVEWTEE